MALSTFTFLMPLVIPLLIMGLGLRVSFRLFDTVLADELHVGAVLMPFVIPLMVMGLGLVVSPGLIRG